MCEYGGRNGERTVVRIKLFGWLVHCVRVIIGAELGFELRCFRVSARIFGLGPRLGLGRLTFAL